MEPKAICFEDGEGDVSSTSNQRNIHQNSSGREELEEILKGVAEAANSPNRAIELVFGFEISVSPKVKGSFEFGENGMPSGEFDADIPADLYAYLRTLFHPEYALPPFILTVLQRMGIPVEAWTRR